MRTANDFLIEDTDVAYIQNSDVMDMTYKLYVDVTDVITTNNPSNIDFVDGDVTVATDTIAETAHGYLTGMKVTELTTTGTLPAGLALSTIYYIIRVDADSFKLATSQANALAGTAVTITAAAGGGTHTVNVETTIAGTVKLQKNNDSHEVKADSKNWIDLDDDEILNNTNSRAYSGATSLNWVVRDFAAKELRAVVTNTSGTTTHNLTITAKGA